MIDDYFAQIKATVDKYAATKFVLSASVNFDTRPGEQGYLTGSITFEDGSALHFREFIDIASGTPDKLMYTYQYQRANKQLVFRYDNAKHRPLLGFVEHKHTLMEVIKASPPALDDVLAEILMDNGWA